MKTFILSLQHLLAMYAGAILVPIIVGTSLKFLGTNCVFSHSGCFMCGVATFYKLTK